jgi:hypothetical protein
MANDINNGTLQVQGMDALTDKLDRLQLNRPSMEKKIETIIRKAINKAKKIVSEQASIAIPHDPHESYKAVKTMVYKQILGGNVSILTKRRKSGKRSSYDPPRTLRPGQRGGNRVKRGKRTQGLMEYTGTDRGMILRWLNSGTKKRMAGTRGGRLSGNRENLSALNWFPSAGQQGMNEAAQYIVSEIDRLIAEEMGG